MSARGEPIARDWCGTLHREGDRVVRVVTLENSPQLLEAVRKEADAAKKVEHASLATAAEIGVESSTLWISIDAPRGMPLSDFLEKGHRLESKRLVRIVLTLGDALAHMHERGRVHGDVSPENVQLHGADRVTLLDFCVSRTTGEKPTPASDQRALAATVHRLLTGNRPSAGASSLAKQRPDLPAGCARAIAKGLSHDPFDSTRSFARAFAGAFLDETALPPHEASIESGIWDVPAREREKNPAKRLAPPRWPRRVSALAILGALLATWWLFRAAQRNTRR